MLVPSADVNTTAREAVRLASERTKVPQIKTWLFQDPKGTWEIQARRYLSDPEMDARACAAGLDRAAFVEAVADCLLFFALTAVRDLASRMK